MALLDKPIDSLKIEWIEKKVPPGISSGGIFLVP
jgi:hypothetical protein